MMAAVGSIRVTGILLPGNGVRTVLPFTTWLVSGSKISFRHTGWPRGSGALHAVLVGLKAPLKSPARMAAVGTTPTVLVMKADWRNCSKLKKKKLLSRPL